MSILLKVERESGGQSIELGNGQITGYSYTNTSPADFLAKAYNTEHSIQIRGEIPLRLLPPVEKDADNSNTLYTWALTEYRPDNDYYRSVTVQIMRHEKTIREVKFTHAYVHVYQERVNGLKGVLEFELVVRQKRDQLDSIQFGTVESIKQDLTKSKEKRAVTLSGISKIEPFIYKDTSKEGTMNVLNLNPLMKETSPLNYSGAIRDGNEEDENLPENIQNEIRFISEYWETTPYPNVKDEIHAVANALRKIGRSGNEYAIMRFNTFIPMKKIVAVQGFVEGTGDGRGFDINSHSNRTVQYAVVDYATGDVTSFNYTGTSHQTWFDEPWRSATIPNDNMSVSPGVNGENLYFSLSSGNPLIPVANIDYKIMFKTDRSAGTISYDGVRNEFPAYEVYYNYNSKGYTPVIQYMPSDNYFSPGGLFDFVGNQAIRGTVKFK
ncbi:hypothetical protein [Paenibacillus elgii]|uniref:hypothetical protein n=1 Tax=Paenibacillus elgii TaxID=189691 RepID=UPI000248D353|nr:hypothetical protein [Paenibacillus elgii]